MKEEGAEIQYPPIQFNPKPFKKYCLHCLQDILSEAIPIQEKVSFPGLLAIHTTHYLHPSCAEQMRLLAQ